MKENILSLLLILSGLTSVCQTVNINPDSRENSKITVLHTTYIVHPLSDLEVVCQPACSVSITDGNGNE
jgi:hypothetical protein